MQIRSPKKILVIGQTPPPYHGQAMMTQRLLEAELSDLELFLIRMSFSKSIKQVGRFSLHKVFHMMEIIWQALKYRLKHKPDSLYYMPGGTHNNPLIRDICILFFLRILYPQTIFHFRAAGVGEFVESRSWWLKTLGKWAYQRPDLAIHLADTNPDDGGYFGAQKTIVIPNGLEDAAENYLPLYRNQQGPVKILFVGVLKESKGVKILLEAGHILQQRGVDVETIFMGASHDPAFTDWMKAYCKTHKLEQKVKFIGVKVEEEKWDYFKQADIFCFPSFFESESFGNVLVEAMMFELPIVTTYWRGIPTIVEQGKNGFLVPIKDAQETANALETLALDHELRIQMGKRGRDLFQQKFRLKTFINNINKALIGV